MTIFFAASEIESFGLNGSVVIRTTAGRFDPDYGRSAIEPVTNGQFIFHTLDTPNSDSWFSAEIFKDLRTDNTDPTLLAVVNSSSQRVVDCFDINSAANLRDVRVRRWNGSSFTNISTENLDIVFNEPSRKKMEFHIVVGASGSIDTFIDGTFYAQHSFSGDTTDLVDLESFRCYSDFNTAYSEVIVADESTLDMRVQSLTPTGNGFHTDWTGDFNDVDSFDDGTSIKTATTEKESFTFSDITASVGGRAIKGLFFGVRANHINAVSPDQVNQFVRISSTDFSVTGPTLGPSSGFLPQQALFAVNPDTLTSWTESEINALEAGVESV